MRLNRTVLLLLVALLAGLIVVDKLRQPPGRPAGEVPARPGQPETAATLGGGPGTSGVAALARQRARTRLREDAGNNYLDSLLVTADSLLRRWDDRRQSALRVGVVEGGAGDYHPRMLTLVREAARRWETAALVVKFAVTRDTSAADIMVRWRGAFQEGTRAGQTDLTWDHRGHLLHAEVSLATRASDGTPLPDDALLAIAIHELGHALGLPHSAQPDDVMYPTTRATEISRRDRATIRLLYELPAGSIRGP